MRRRLTIAILGVVIGTLVLTVAGSLLLIRRAAVSTAEGELVTETSDIGAVMATHPAVTDEAVGVVLRRVGVFDRLRVVGVGPAGALGPLPPPVVAADLNVAALLAGRAVAGNVGRIVFVAEPLALTAPQRAALAPGVGAGEVPVLVVTRHVTSPVNGVPYFLLVAGVVLVAGVAVATVLARRISAPLVRAVSATRQMAGGNLAATVPVDRGESPELVELAESINTLGENLSRAQGMEREFLLSVSHELRTPLTSIRGYADAIADGATDDVAGAVAIIGAEARRLERLVQDLLDLARVQARQFSLQTQRIDCGGLLAAAVEGFQPEADAAGVLLSAAVQRGAGLWVDADPDRLGQIVANLVENALKFATARVEVGAGRSGAWTALWVVDDGPGIAPGDLGHVFERHFTSDRMPARKTGAGLGLAIVAELAAAMGATVDAQSPVHDGRGARMVVWLAGRAAPDGEPAPPPGPVAGPAGMPTSALPLRPPT